MALIGMKRVLDSTSETFVTDFGIRFRRKSFKSIQKLLTPSIKKKIVVEHYPELEKDTPYIFASNHWFLEDFMISLAKLDRDVFSLFGSTNQIESHPVISFLTWLPGMVYVDRSDKEKRRDAMNKMIRLLKSGASVFLCPEGAYNNTENLLCLPLFASPYMLNQTTGAKVVPIAVYSLPELDAIYGNYGEPMDFTGMERDEAMELLRDTLATMHYEQIEKYGGILKRSDLEGRDYRTDFMMQRRAEYMKMHFTRDVWDEELPTYHDRSITDPQTVREELSHVKITPANANILAPILVRYEEDVKYDFARFMHETWNKKLPGDPEKW